VKAVLVQEFGLVPVVADVAAPELESTSVIVEVAATGLCRSDWHGWLGHDPDISLPHVPGHEFAGTIAEVGADIVRVNVGDRVTVPFVCACGSCRECAAGNDQTCLRQQQPGFTYWGSFAEYLSVPWADHNIVLLPAELSFATAAGLGCRFATAYRGVQQVAHVGAEDDVVILGCGGVGLSAVMIAAARRARVIAVDVNPSALELASSVGAAQTVLVDRRDLSGLGVHLVELTDGGADVVVEALGSGALAQQALLGLRPRGRLVQIGLLPGRLELDLGVLIGRELQWLGSHGMAARYYPEMLAEIASGHLDPGRLVRREISLAEAPRALAELDEFGRSGVTVIRPHG
jgi:D-arabinose 1-dehydrogenase-like Zn-dependent alcohol dehydrogenase